MQYRTILAATAMLMASSLARAETCDRVLGTHGFKAAAQVACGLGQRPNQALDWARTCARRQDPAVNLREIQTGTLVFTATERRMGRAEACRSVLRDFRGVLFQR